MVPRHLWALRLLSALVWSALLALALTPTIAVARSACGELQGNLPPRGPARLAAGDRCIDELPNLSRAEQTQIVRQYAKALPDYIDPAKIDEVVDSLPRDVGLPLAAFALRYSSITQKETLDQRVKQLVQYADRQNDDLAKSHLEFFTAAQLLRRGGDNASMEEHLQRALAYANKSKATGLVPYITNLLAIRAKIDGELDLAVLRYSNALKQFEEGDDLGSTGIVYANIGFIFSDFGDTEQSIDMLRKAIDVYLDYLCAGIAHYDHGRSKCVFG
jgi:tetratricopeptide (TPR) repeat protein